MPSNTTVRFEELGGFFQDQRWMHMHHVLRSLGITFCKLGHRGIEAALAILEEEGFMRKECYVLSTLLLIFRYMYYVNTQGSCMQTLRNHHRVISSISSSD